MGCHCRCGCDSGGRCFFVVASLILTGASIAVGISFFGPYWLNNVHLGKDAHDETTKAWINYVSKDNTTLTERPYRGLWAQCGKECTWFWENKYQLQKEKFTPLKWHLATQILYFIAAAIILGAEIFARVQMCCRKEYSVFYIILGILLLASVLLQTASLATFGGGASRDPYNSISDPVKIGKILQQEISGVTNTVNVYLGWCYWMALVGDFLTLLSAIFFFLASFCSDGCFCCREK